MHTTVSRILRWSAAGAAYACVIAAGFDNMSRLAATVFVGVFTGAVAGAAASVAAPKLLQACFTGIAAGL